MDNSKKIIWILFLSSLIYLTLSFQKFINGVRGELRGSAVFFITVSIFLCYIYRKFKVSEWISIFLLLLLFLNSFSQVILSPGCDYFGLTPKDDWDFKANYYGGIEIYKEGNSPYNIHEKFKFKNPSISFPYPTYLFFYMSSLGGILNPSQAGLVFSVTNLILLLLLLFLLNKIFDFKKIEDASKWKYILLILVILNSHIWGVLMNGQSLIIITFMVVFSLYLYYSGKNKVSSFFIASFGVLIKPFFGLFLVNYFVKENNKGRAILVLIFLLTLSLPLLLPGGVEVKIFKEFFTDISSTLYKNALSTNRNCSMVGFINQFFIINELIVKILFFSGLIFSLIYGFKQKKGWSFWLITAMLLSPLCWTNYSTVLLPVIIKKLFEFLKYKKNDILILSLIVFSGLFQLDFSITGFIALSGLLMIELKNVVNYEEI